MSSDSIEQFRAKLRTLTRKELLEIIKDQDVEYIQQINRIEYVFKYKLTHLTWDDGTPIHGKPLTKEELILLIDPPFIFSRELAKDGFTEEQQRFIHIASDPVLWAKHFLEDYPRVYQTLVLRDPSRRKVMRFGRRAGKTTTMAFFCLWYCYTNNEAKILVMAPVKTHVGLIYDEVLRMAKQNKLILDESDKLAKCAIVRYVQSPQFQIDFDNGAQIKFFTTGMKSNGKADVARGQEADVIILDEMDYMGKEDLVALLAMLQKTSGRKTTKKQMIAASTPTGQRNVFWEWNTDPQHRFKSFWFPSYANPFWDKETEEQMRIDYPNEQHYRHEVEADWGEDVEGVYPHKYVKAAFRDDSENDDAAWNYNVGVTTARSFFVFGVDWDKYAAGVNIVVLEVCAADHENPQWAGKVRLCYREEVEKSDFTYTIAVDRIVELNDVYHPRHIYVDRGGGEVQIEMLQKYGMEHKSTGLNKVLHGIQFSEGIEVRDPFTQEKIKKRAKVLMVDNLYRMLEQEKIIFTGNDSELFVQLLSYVVLRTSATTGDPVFAPGGNTTDHIHDALILAAYAIADNYDEIFNPVYATKSVAVSNDAFLSTFEVVTQQDREIAADKWGEGKGPVMIHRSMAYNIKGKRNVDRSGIKRKMF